MKNRNKKSRHCRATVKRSMYQQMKNRNKKSICWIFMLLLCGIMLLSGCGEKTTDEAFTDDLTTALTERWDQADSNESDYGALAQTEYDILKKYQDQTFENKELGTLAKEYITAVETQVNAADYLESDYNKFAEMYWIEGGTARYDTLSTMIKEELWEVPEGYQASWKDMKATNEEVEKSNHIEVLNMRVTGDSLAGTTYCYPLLKIKNNTKEKIDMVQMELQVLDKNGSVLETISPMINNLAPQQTGWTQKTFLQSDLDKVAAFEVSGFDLSRQTAPSSFMPYESTTYIAAPHFEKKDIKIQIKEY